MTYCHELPITAKYLAVIGSSWQFGIRIVFLSLSLFRETFEILIISKNLHHFAAIFD